MPRRARERLEMTSPGALAAVRDLLRAFGIDPDEPRFADTPRRVAQAYEEFFAGVGLDERAPLRRGDAVPAGVDIVTLRGLEFRSTCAHHLLPFAGVVDVVYVPRERLVGIGSIVRTLEIISTRPQLQEHLAQELADAVHDGAQAHGALVRISARHSCIADRGPREAASTVVVLASSGCLRDPAQRTAALHSLQAPDAPC